MSYTYRHLDSDANRIFSHLLKLRETSYNDELLSRFKALFINGDRYPEQDILASLNRVLASDWADQAFSNIFNRCCYILINYWWLRRRWWLTSDLIQLIDIAANQPPASPATADLRRQLKQFTKSRKYQQLRDCERVINFIPPGSTHQVEVIGGLISQYPYLYPYYLKEWDTQDSGHQQMLKELQQTREKEFESSLFNYIKGTRQEGQGSHNGSTSTIHKPTSLSPEKLQFAIRCFTGKVEGADTYQDKAKKFLAHFNRLPDHRAVKHSVGEYLIKSIQHTSNPLYGEHKFNRWLLKQLDESLFERENSKPNHRLLMHICRTLIDALITPPNNSRNFENHLMFVDLITNLEATFAIGFLLKIVLLCQTFQENLSAIREYVAERFAHLFKYYESSPQNDLNWLIECLDNWLIASTVQFGRWEQPVWASLVCPVSQ